MDKKKIECSAAIQVLPLLEGDALIGVVDKVIAYIQSTGLRYTVGPFETTVEGDFETIMAIIKECQLICIREGTPHVISHIKIAYAPGLGVWSIDEKVSKHQT